MARSGPYPFLLTDSYSNARSPSVLVPDSQGMLVLLNALVGTMMQKGG